MLSLVPRDFTNVMKPFVWAVCNKGIRLGIYLDDILVVSSSREIFCRGNYNCYSYSRVIGFYC